MWNDVGIGLCKFTIIIVSSLPCLHTSWHAIPTSFHILNVFLSLVSLISKQLIKDTHLIKDMHSLNKGCNESQALQTGMTVQGMVTPIVVVVTAATGVKIFWLLFRLLDHLTTLQMWPFTVDRYCSSKCWLWMSLKTSCFSWIQKKHMQVTNDGEVEAVLSGIKFYDAWRDLHSTKHIV